ncbi:hypothetical protein MBLNU457_3717t1 [Dothideomycetes sp. NU457]
MHQSHERARAENDQTQYPAVMANKRGNESRGRAEAQDNQDQTRTRGEKKTFPLLALSAELRNEIYRLVLRRGRIVVQITFGDEVKNYPHDAVPTRALTQVCRQIRQETLPIYFRDNKFVIRSDFRRSPQFWSSMMTSKYRGAQEVWCLKYWLEERVPAENLCNLKRISLPLVAANDFWGSTRSFGSLALQLDWFAESLCAGIDQLIPSSVLLQSMRETAAAYIPVSLLDKCIADYVSLAHEVKADPASNPVQRAKVYDSWINTLAPEDQILVKGQLKVANQLNWVEED